MSHPFKPYVSSHTVLREFSLRAILLGLAFGVLFAVANAYLALKIGQTISASIPAAVMSMALLRAFFKTATILENNIVQTIATVGEGLAAGVIFTIPALFLLGEAPSIGRIFLLSSLGGILGILFMIPMRRFIIVQEHKSLPFPEGTACAEILKAGETKDRSAIMALWGVLISSFYKICSSALFLWNETPVWTASWFQRTIFSLDATPALLGVGYLIGPRISGYMFAGGFLAWWGILPLIHYFSAEQVDLSADAIWSEYIRYIGAGTIAVGGIMGLIRVVPLLHKTIHVGFKELLAGFKIPSHLERCDRDISLSYLLIGSLAIVLVLWLFPGLPMNFFTILLLVVLSFFFVAVTSLTVGLVGSTSNPVSGMTITTLLITCLAFVLLGWTERIYLVSAILMGCVACVAICMAGTTAQDLKTGFLLGATPRLQQIGEIIGVILPSLALGYTVYLLNAAYGIGSAAMPAPQATLMALIAQGVMSGELPYFLVGIGVVIGIALAVLRIPILPFALGLYLPFSLTTATMVGGLVKEILDRSSPSEHAHKRGLLLASGFVGGDACTGVIIALLAILQWIPASAPGFFRDEISILAYLFLGALLLFFSLRSSSASD